MSIHDNAEPRTVELLLERIVALNQVSIFGAVAKWCNNQTPPSVQSHAFPAAAPEVPPDLVTRLTKHNTFKHQFFGKKLSAKYHHIV